MNLPGDHLIDSRRIGRCRERTDRRFEIPHPLREDADFEGSSIDGLDRDVPLRLAGDQIPPLLWNLVLKTINNETCHRSC